MKIAYVIPTLNALYGKSNGITMQATTWANGLRELGHDVVLVNPWEDYDWKSFDLIQFFGVEKEIVEFLNVLIRRNCKCAVAPIIDTERPWWLSRLAGKLTKCSPLHMTSPWSEILKLASLQPYFFVRSDYESNYVHKALKIPQREIFKVPLTCRFASSFASLQEVSNYRKSCLHVSILSGHHKNVRRLIQAAIKYDFELLLAGKCDDLAFKFFLDKICSEHENIKYLGRVNDDELRKLYSEVKCFALPSLFEGVGLVALEAAACGCGIVLTDRGAPKEYYNGMAHLVDPESVDSIGEAICSVLNGDNKQPELANYVNFNYSSKKISALLENAYFRIIK